MANPIRRTVVTVGTPAAVAQPDAVCVDEEILRQELNSYLNELADPVVESNQAPASATTPDLIEHEIRVEIPRIDTPLHCRSVIADLEAAFAQTPPNSRWIVDLRALDALPLLLIGALERYHQELSVTGGVMRLEVSAANNYSEQILTRLASAFELHYIDHENRTALHESDEVIDVDQIVQPLLRDGGDED